MCIRDRRERVACWSHDSADNHDDEYRPASTLPQLLRGHKTDGSAGEQEHWEFERSPEHEEKPEREAEVVGCTDHGRETWLDSEEEHESSRKDVVAESSTTRE